MDPVLSAPGVAVNTVVFTPQARTFWHSHPGGQLLVVTAGRGVVARKSGESHLVEGGDLVWAEPGEEHWHGASGDALMAHTAISHGATEWHEEVSEADYRASLERAGGDPS